MQLVFILLLGLVLGGSTLAGEIVTILSSDAKPYMDAQSAAQDRLGKKGLKIRSIALKDLTEDKIKEWNEKPPEGVLAIGTEAAEALHRHPKVIAPEFYCMVADPDGHGLTQGLAMQGVTIDVPLGAQIELIEQALPKTRSIGILYRGKSEKGKRISQAVRTAWPAKYKIETVDVDHYGSSSKAIEALLALKVDVIWTYPDPEVYNSALVRALLLAALREKVPVFGFSRPFVNAGALLGVGIDPKSQGEQVSEVIARYHEGRSKSPDGFTALAQVEAPRFEISINTTVAEQLSIRLPNELVKRAIDSGEGD